MAARVRAAPWAETSIGPLATWPEGLRILISQVLASPMPTKLVWGAELIQIYNDAYIPILGHKHPAALGLPMRLSSPEIWTARASVYDALLRDGLGVFENDREVRVAGSDGVIEDRKFTVGYAPVRRADGTVQGVVVTLIETTARVRAETLLRESRERLELIIEHAEVGILQTDMDSRIIYVNPAFAALVGRDEAALRSLRIADISHPDDIGPNMAAFAEMLRTGKPFLLDKRYMRPDGAVVWVHNNVSFTRAPDGMGLHAIAIVQDITERKLMADELERRVAERTGQLAASERRACALFMNSPDLRSIVREREPGVFVFDDANPAVLAALGMAREQLVGTTLRDLFGLVAEEESEPRIRECLALNSPVTFESRRMMRGEERWFESTVSPLPGISLVEAGPVVLISSRDITERRALEEQLRQAQKMEAVGQLTGGIAHDFNNLLTVITGNLELIGRKSSDEAARRRASNAMRAAGRGAELTAQLLAFSRRQFLSVTAISLNAVVVGMRDMLERTMGGRVAVRTALAPALGAALGDATQIETALLNLAINARDAMRTGGTVTIRTENVPRGTERLWLGRVPEEFAERDAVLVSVADTGEGMSEAVLARAFEPFFTTKDVGKGSGLGLSMVYGVAKQLGGAVVIASTPGEGTAVGIYLPATIEEILPDPAAGLVKLRSEATIGAHVLVVDDDHDVRELTASFLRELGYRTTEAATGQDVMAQLRAGAACDLLLVDLAMPGLSGTETARLARDLRPGIAVLFVSGYADISSFAAEEAARLLRKPFSVAELDRAIREVLLSSPAPL